MITETPKPADSAVSVKEKPMEFVPFGSQDLIRLNINMVRHLIAVPTKSGVLPGDNDCTKFLMMCKARRLNPYEGDAYLIGYDAKDGAKFSLITAIQAFLKRAECHKEYDGIESGVVVVKDDTKVVEEHPGDIIMDGFTLIGGWAKVFFKTRSHPTYKRVALKTFNKGFGQWLTNPAGMIVKCAEADSLRTAFPTILGGLYIQEEMSEVATASRVATPIFKDKSAPVDAVVTVEPPPEDKWKKIMALSERDGIDELTLMDFLWSSGLVEAEKNLTFITPDNADTVLERWDEFSKTMRGAK